MNKLDIDRIISLEKADRGTFIYVENDTITVEKVADGYYIGSLIHFISHLVEDEMAVIAYIERHCI